MPRARHGGHSDLAAPPGTKTVPTPSGAENALRMPEEPPSPRAQACARSVCSSVAATPKSRVCTRAARAKAASSMKLASRAAYVRTRAARTCPADANVGKTSASKCAGRPSRRTSSCARRNTETPRRTHGADVCLSGPMEHVFAKIAFGDRRPMPARTRTERKAPVQGAMPASMR